MKKAFHILLITVCILFMAIAVVAFTQGELIGGVISLMISIIIAYPILEQFKADKVNIKQKSVEELNEEYKQMIHQYNTETVKEKDKISVLNYEYKKEKERLEKELDELEHELTSKYISEKDYSDINSAQIKNDLAMLELKEKNLLKDGATYFIEKPTSKKTFHNLQRQILKSFTADCKLAFNKLTYSNVDTTRSKIIKSFESINKIYEIDGIEITEDYLNIKLDELGLLYEYNKKIANEKDQQRAIKEEMREQAKAQAEIEREKARIEKELTQFSNEQHKLIQYMQKANNEVETKIYADKIKELEEKVKLLEKDKENVLQREQNTRAGYVYVISNIGSFGEDVYKIGMTRRLEPMDRVKELGDASVPFEFDVHAMIFSEDAPHLETLLHEHFRDNQVNKVNARKEFFKVKLNEIEKVVKEQFNATVEFTEIAKAEQYRESLRLSK